MVHKFSRPSEPGNQQLVTVQATSCIIYPQVLNIWTLLRNPQACQTVIFYLGPGTIWISIPWTVSCEPKQFQNLKTLTGLRDQTILPCKSKTCCEIEPCLASATHNKSGNSSFRLFFSTPRIQPKMNSTIRTHLELDALLEVFLWAHNTPSKVSNQVRHWFFCEPPIHFNSIYCNNDPSKFFIPFLKEPKPFT